MEFLQESGPPGGGILRFIRRITKVASATQLIHRFASPSTTSSCTCSPGPTSTSSSCTRPVLVPGERGGGSGGGRYLCGVFSAASRDWICDPDRAIAGTSGGDGGPVLKEEGDIGADLIAISDGPREWDVAVALWLGADSAARCRGLWALGSRRRKSSVDPRVGRTAFPR